MATHSSTRSWRRTVSPRRRSACSPTPKFAVRNLHAPDGGGFWYGPEENRIELFGIQAEAAIHEMAHAWADLTGFYDEWGADWDRWPTLNRTFRADVRRAAEERDPNYPRICFIAGEYEFGNPQTGFAGMFENDSERFAGLRIRRHGRPDEDAALYPTLVHATLHGPYHAPSGQLSARGRIASGRRFALVGDTTSAITEG